ncbi:hypothetical protein [Gluconobacter roseus]|uniref:hypothetical protein n=1 Tax=Gluconobacter roseus TaxID=586239 RepID=UPI000783C799|nr:hypothetical protein [Gluconobacter roseus]KXV44590.1 hypothetical protein AD943_02675 [Gluconobacter roseus]
MSIFSHSAVFKVPLPAGTYALFVTPSSKQSSTPVAGSGIGLAAFLGTCMWIAGGYWLFS